MTVFLLLSWCSFETWEVVETRLAILLR